jgi:hypothetical protein
MQKPELAPDEQSHSAMADLLRSGRDALANDVFKQLPKSEAEFRALVATRPVLMSAVAVAAGCAAMQLVLAALRREPRTAAQAPAGHHWLSVATALWPFVRRPASPTQAVDGRGADGVPCDDVDDGVDDGVNDGVNGVDDGVNDPGPRGGRPKVRWHVADLWPGHRVVDKAVQEASETAKAKARDAARLAEDVSDAVVEHVAMAAKNQPVWTLVAAAGVGFAVTWLSARR